ncbi:MAG: DEAD/DEAH box helicase [Actinomycetota bacterium]|nr:DEAD/DEAH box helicase [Actinomycetota bacterium]
MSFAPGALVSARGREWVIQPGSSDQLLLLQPVGGADSETVGILTSLEEVRSARFEWPGPDDVGSALDAQLLRDAVKLGFRSSAGPFRSFARIGVEPRPYQLVPLLMAMRLDPVRLLIADDVGIGKTVEAGLIAVELLATGQAQRLAVLCPPHLAEQWGDELSAKFHLDPTLVLSSTAPRLERGLSFGESLFERHRVTVVSTDFIKTDRRRAEFLRDPPDLVIVDEAHTCAADPGRRSARHQRHELIRDLANKSDHHLILVTATPHSGKEGAFRSLVGLLHPRLAELLDDQDYPQQARELITERFIQRKRPEIREYLDEETPFPERYNLPEQDGLYRLTPQYTSLVEAVRSFSRERLTEGGLDPHHQRMRYWALLGLLRHVASSPRAAAATLRSRNPASTTETAEQADEAGRDAVFDRDLNEEEAAPDTVTGVLETEDDPQTDRFEQLAIQAERLEGPATDAKLAHTIHLVRVLLRDGFLPIVFCKYIETAEYVADHLRKALPPTVSIDAVTGRLPPDHRERAVQALANSDKRILVATDCLSEGINLQHLFSAVVHYDLPWTPTGLEQREGRVDRYGQDSPQVRIATLYSSDTAIDELVMDVLLRKHRTIRNTLGVAIPVPVPTDEFLETAVDRLFATDRLFILPSEGTKGRLALNTDDEYAANKRRLFTSWDAAADKEQATRTRYAQRAIKTDAVRRELRAVRGAIGSGVDVARFVATAVRAYGGTVEPDPGDLRRLRVGLTRLPSDLRDTLRLALDLNELPEAIWVRTEEPVPAGELLVTRTHPFVAALAAHVVDGALDRHVNSPARRAGAIRTDAVDSLTMLLLLRHRYDLTTGSADGARDTQLVEDTSLVGFRPTDQGISWLEPDEAETLMTTAKPTGNLTDAQRRQFAATVLDSDRFPDLQHQLEQHVRDCARAALEAHRRVREQARGRLGRTDISPHLPADVLGAYLLIPS